MCLPEVSRQLSKHFPSLLIPVLLSLFSLHSLFALWPLCFHIGFLSLSFGTLFPN